jgi:hypothetical protein
VSEILEAVAVLVINWRVGLTVFGSIVVAIFLASTLPWFSSAYGVGLVLVSLGVGMQGAADAASPQSKQDEESRERQ